MKSATRHDVRKRVYFTPRWRRLRERKLKQHPLCERCEEKGFTTAATLVHHRVPIRSGGDPFPPVEGLEALCHPCHNEEHTGLSPEQRQFQGMMLRCLGSPA